MSNIVLFFGFYCSLIIVYCCLVCTLVANSADPQVMDRAGETVLHWACKSEEENDEMVKLVLEK